MDTYASATVPVGLVFMRSLASGDEQKLRSNVFCAGTTIGSNSFSSLQDIAFRIVNKEWEYSHKKGFKSIFERGILHVYFNFVRHRYRR